MKMNRTVLSGFIIRSLVLQVGFNNYRTYLRAVAAEHKTAQAAEKGNSGEKSKAGY